MRTLRVLGDPAGRPYAQARRLGHQGFDMELPQLPPLKGIFVTGTDTDVGKTVIAAGLTAALRRRGVGAVYFKPMQSGCPEEAGELVPTDARFARELAGLDEPLRLLTPIALRLPLAPGVAAAREGVAVDLERIAAAIWELSRRYEFFVVEGAGGLYVPLIGNDFLVLDLVRWLKLPLLVVARAGLGTINHTALTVMAARQAGHRGGRGYPEPRLCDPRPGGADQSGGHRGHHRAAHPGPGAGGGGSRGGGGPGAVDGGLDGVGDKLPAECESMACGAPKDGGHRPPYM